MRRRFGVSAGLPPPLLRVIHPFFLCAESQASLYKTPVVLSAGPLDPGVTVAAPESQSERRDGRSLGIEGTGMCVCVRTLASHF